MPLRADGVIWLNHCRNSTAPQLKVACTSNGSGGYCKEPVRCALPAKLFCRQSAGAIIKIDFIKKYKTTLEKTIGSI